MPPKRVKKPKKPVLQKQKPKAIQPEQKPSQRQQKQKQSQAIVVNVNPQKRAPAKRRPAQPRQPQVSYQPIITTSGSVPVSAPAPAPMPIQSASGFAPMIPTPISLGTSTSISAPVVLPSFAEESARVIGGEDINVPVITSPITAPTPTAVPPAETSSSSSSIISQKPSFFQQSVKGVEFTDNPIISEPKETVVFKKPQTRKVSPYNPFEEANVSPEETQQLAFKPFETFQETVRKATASAEDIPSDIATRGTVKVKQPKKIKEPAREKSSNYKSKEDFQFIAKERGIDILRPSGKPKTRDELRLEIIGVVGKAS